MDGNFITTIRTGAVGAIAAKYLARKNSKVAATLCCGTQGRMQLTALKWVLPIRDVRCYDISPKNAEVFAKEMSSQDCTVKWVSSPEEAVKCADVVVTTTPSERWIVSSDWIDPGMHISAMGADTKGKQEIDPISSPGPKSLWKALVNGSSFKNRYFHNYGSGQETSADFSSPSFSIWN
jgi:ornithine cyclodeaminase